MTLHVHFGKLRSFSSFQAESAAFRGPELLLAEGALCFKVPPTLGGCSMAPDAWRGHGWHAGWVIQSLPWGWPCANSGGGRASAEGWWFVLSTCHYLSLGAAWLAHPGQGPYRLQDTAQSPEAGRLPHLPAFFSSLLCLPGWPCNLCDWSESCQKPGREHRGPWAVSLLGCTPTAP